MTIRGGCRHGSWCDWPQWHIPLSTGNCSETVGTAYSTISEGGWYSGLHLLGQTGNAAEFPWCSVTKMNRGQHSVRPCAQGQPSEGVQEWAGGPWHLAEGTGTCVYVWRDPAEELSSSAWIGLKDLDTSQPGLQRGGARSPVSVLPHSPWKIHS